MELSSSLCLNLEPPIEISLHPSVDPSNSLRLNLELSSSLSPLDFLPRVLHLKAYVENRSCPPTFKRFGMTVIYFQQLQFYQHSELPTQ